MLRELLADSLFTELDYKSAELLSRRLAVLADFLDETGNFPEGYNVLDIGCGGVLEGWMPIFAEGLGRLGANVYGIDLGNQPKGMKTYAHIQADFLEQSLNELLPEGIGFDLIVWLNVTGSVPSDVYKESVLNNQKRFLTYQEAEELILRQLPDLLVPGGIAMVETFTHDGMAILMKSDKGNLVRLS